MKIVVTAGNHDSSSRLELNGELWEAFDVTVVGNIERKDDGVNYDKHIVEIKRDDNEPCGYIIALPYIYHANYPATENDDETASRMQQFHQKLIDRVSAKNSNNLPIIMTGHLAVSGSNIKGHETKQTHLVYENIEELGSGYDYLALGHIHHPQTISGTKNARYSGSPFAMSFDEEYPHSISVVEIKEKGAAPQIREIEIAPQTPLYTIPEEGGDIEEVMQAIEQLPSGNSYVRVKLKVQDVIPMHERRIIEEKFASIEAELCELYPIRIQKSEESSIHLEELKENSPLEIAMDYYRRQFDSEMDEELKQMLIECIEKSEEHKNEENI